YGAYVTALSEWIADQKITAWEAKRQQAEQQRIADAEARRIHTSFEERKAAARLKHPDFDAVALESETAIPAGSLIAAWILEHKTGAEVLYHLQSHPDELDALLKGPVLEQAESLALLSQRFSSNGRSRAAETGSAPATNGSPPPRPPNPVRTGPLRSGSEPPDPDKASLAEHERYWSQQRSRRA